MLQQLVSMCHVPELFMLAAGVQSATPGTSGRQGISGVVWARSIPTHCDPKALCMVHTLAFHEFTAAIIPVFYCIHHTGWHQVTVMVSW